MMLWLLILSFLLSAHTMECETEETNLLSVHMVMRHGDRAPVRLYLTDPNPENLWPLGLGQLTKLGQKQLFNHGRLMRSMYKNFITSNPNEIFVNSSDVERCRMSAQAFLATFYRPNPQYQFEQGINWQPIAIHSQPSKSDKYLSPFLSCPAGDMEQTKFKYSAENQMFLSKYKKLLHYLATHTGMNVGETDAVLLQDTLFAEEIHKLIIPDWVYPCWSNLKDFSNHVMFAQLKSPVLQKLHAGPLLGQILKEMKRKASGELPEMKVRLFVGHDYNLIALFESLRMYNMQRPPYAATFLMELHQTLRDQRSVVRFLYFNSTKPELSNQAPHILQLPGCGEFCPLEQFEESIKSVVPQDWSMECITGHDRPSILWH